jgi:hypothetical protein
MGKAGVQGMTRYGKALTVLARYFQVTTDTFERLPRQMVIEWADDIIESIRTKVPIPLRTWQHRMLIGEDGMSFHRTKLIERLSPASLVACAVASGRTVQQLMVAAGVRG